MKIKKIFADEILDSRGNPTVQCSVQLDDGQLASASVPSGASVGKAEALELRDNDPKRFGGKGVLKAIENIEAVIAPELEGKDARLTEVDKKLIALDGTHNKKKLGANAILAVSMAVARVQAQAEGKPLYELLNEVFDAGDPVVPGCMFNILNGGMHANNGVTFQEFMIMPAGFETLAEAVHAASRVYQELKTILHSAGLATTVGDEGGFAPRLPGRGFKQEEAALHFLMEAIEQAGFSAEQMLICLDVAASSFFDAKKQMYNVGSGEISAEALIDFYSRLVEDFPIYSIEDGASEDDEHGWKLMTKLLGDKVQLVGDDVFVTNQTKIEWGVANQIANAVLIKPNQIGTVSEAYGAVQKSKLAGYKTVVSHRSGETNDSFIADFVVGSAAGQIKAGAPARGERVAKYNRLMAIERLLG